MQLFCFGFGYVAQHLAREVGAQCVYGTSRQQMGDGGGKTRIQAQDSKLRHLVFNGMAPLTNEGVAALEQATHILISIPPQEAMDGLGVDRVLRHHRQHIRQEQWLGYLSTTGVYGDWQGEWVDETCALRATSPRSLRRIEAEQEWRELGAHIFRLAGIYGPERNALERVRKGVAQRIHKEGVYFSRAHVEDIVQVLIASMQQPHAGEIYNICDDEPAPAHEVVSFACQLLGVEPPALQDIAQVQLSPMMESFYADSRRVRNDKIKQQLGVVLRYPDYRVGLEAIALGLDFA